MPNNRRRNHVSKPVVALIMAIGLLTFFTPIVTTDVPVHGRSDWAPVDLLVERADRWLPAPGPFHVHDILYVIGALYALMLVAMVLLALPSPRPPLSVVATVGSALGVGTLRWGHQGFSWLLYGRFNYAWISSTHDRFVTAVIGWEGFRFDAAFPVLTMVMPALLVAVRTPRRAPDEAPAEPTVAPGVEM